MIRERQHYPQTKRNCWWTELKAMVCIPGQIFWQIGESGQTMSVGRATYFLSFSLLSVWNSSLLLASHPDHPAHECIINQETISLAPRVVNSKSHHYNQPQCQLQGVRQTTLSTFILSLSVLSSGSSLANFTAEFMGNKAARGSQGSSGACRGLTLIN